MCDVASRWRMAWVCVSGASATKGRDLSDEQDRRVRDCERQGTESELRMSTSDLVCTRGCTPGCGDAMRSLLQSAESGDVVLARESIDTILGFLKFVLGHVGHVDFEGQDHANLHPPRSRLGHDRVPVGIVGVMADADIARFEGAKEGRF